MFLDKKASENKSNQVLVKIFNTYLTNRIDKMNVNTIYEIILLPLP
jgi:hypothetical protein